MGWNHAWAEHALGNPHGRVAITGEPARGVFHLTRALKAAETADNGDFSWALYISWPKECQLCQLDKG